MAPRPATAPTDYPALLAGLKTAIRSARLKAALAVNAELLQLYWCIGREILERQSREGWGSRVVERPAQDLRAEFPEMTGLSSRNLVYMRSFAGAWPEDDFTQQPVARLPWGHITILLDKITDRDTRLFYAREAHERHVEAALVTKVRDFLLEMGKGFAFVGSQHPLKVGGEDWYVDILFYHRKLRCLVAVDLKMDAFRPDYAGKMNFYLAALDDLEREPGDNPSIGLILCRDRNRVVVEYALRAMQAPIGVAGYTVTVTDVLPPELEAALPTAEEIEAEIPAAALDQDGRTDVPT